MQRIIGEYVAGRAPLPPEIALNRAGSSFFKLQAMAELYGVADHSVYLIFRENKIKAGMAHAIDHGAPYTARVLHKLASEGETFAADVYILDPVSPFTQPTPTPPPSTPIPMANQPVTESETSSGLEDTGDFPPSGGGQE